MTYYELPTQITMLKVADRGADLIVVVSSLCELIEVIRSSAFIQSEIKPALRIWIRLFSIINSIFATRGLM